MVVSAKTDVRQTDVFVEKQDNCAIADVTPIYLARTSEYVQYDQTLLI